MKKIAITQRLLENESYPEIRDALDINWGKFFETLGVLPVILPTAYDFQSFFAEFKIDGIILSGGNDLTCCADSPLSRQRDNFEKKLLAYAIKERIPVMGVCRGMQLIADYFGAKLVSIAGHSGGSRHRLFVEGNSGYSPLLKRLDTVNSYHAYGVHEIPAELVVAARSPDGVIEAIEHRTLPIFGQMWHPEREQPQSSAELAVVCAALAIEDNR